METLKSLYEYFPTAVYTGKCLVFISEDWRVELTEHKDSDYTKTSSQPSVIRVRVFKKALNGEFVPGHFEDFQLPSLSELAEQIEKYVQLAMAQTCVNEPNKPQITDAQRKSENRKSAVISRYGAVENTTGG